jgi:transcription initiation factor IIE alpha subunit
LARIKLKLGENEIEVDSRDFYVDNQTLGEVIDSISHHLPENHAKIVYETESITKSTQAEHSAQFGLEYLDDAEVYEPEFSEPKYITSHEIKSKLRILETSRFFDSPRTVTETVEQLREYGWASSPLEVSKALAKMASNKEIMKNSYENRTHYFIQEPLVSN